MRRDARAATSSIARGSPPRRAQTRADGVGVFRREREVRPRRLGPFDEKGHRRRLRDPVARGIGRLGGQREGIQEHPPLLPNPKRCAAGRDDAQPGTLAQQVGDDWDAAQRLLEVVEHEQQLLARQVLREATRGVRAGLVDVERPGDGRCDGRGITRTCEWDEEGAVLEFAQDVGGEMERERGLAHAGRAGDGQQTRAVPADASTCHGEIALPPDQSRRR